jgi:hypothetical protein
MQFVTFEDETEMIEGSIAPFRLRELGRPFTTPGPFLVAGRVRADDRLVHLTIASVRPFHERHGPR